jgi:hypothetical protein
MAKKTEQTSETPPQPGRKVWTVQLLGEGNRPSDHTGPGPLGLTYEKGRAQTADPIRAHACLEHGDVFDAEGKPAFGSKPRQAK